MPRRSYLLAFSIIVNRRIMDDNDDLDDVTVPYNSQWHVALKKLIIHETLRVSEIGKESVKKILAEYLPTCPVNLLEEEIFRHVCPFLKQNICELVDKIEAKLADPLEAENLEANSFDCELIECKNLLTRWESILKHVSALKEVKPGDVVSLLEHFPGVVTKICLHCKEKRANYPNRSLPLLFQDIYRETCSNVKLFCGFIFKSLAFQEKESLLLKKLIKDLGEIASITIYFLTTMIQSWKTFGKLACGYYSVVKKDPEALELVTGFFKNISADILWVYENMMKTSDDDSKGGKCINLLLEILYRVHKFYVDAESAGKSGPKHQCVHEMVNFLIQLSGFYETKMFFKSKQKNSQAKDVFSYSWVDMLIKYYKNCPVLHEELRIRKDEMAIANMEYLVGYHVILLKSDLAVDEKVQIAFNNLNYFQEEFMATRIEISNMRTEKSEVTTASIYEYTLLNICDCVRGSKFKDLELFIFKNLLSEKFWPSLLCFDILQHLYRNSNEELPLSHIKILSTVYEKLHTRESTSLGVTLIGKLIICAYKSVSTDKKKEFQDTCQSPASLLLILKSPKISNSREELVAAHKKLVSVKAVDLPAAYQELRVQPSVKNWIDFMNHLVLKSIDKIEDNPDVTSDLHKIFQSTLDTLNQVNDDFKQRIVYDLILILINCSIVRKSTDTDAFNWNFFPVLAKEIVHTIKLPDIYLVEICHFIQRNSKLLKIPPGQVDARVNVINLICCLLSSNSPIVHQEALETFEYIVENGADDDFVLKLGTTITKKYNLLEVVPNYLKKRSVKKLSHEFADINDYFKMFTVNLEKFSSAHKCYLGENRGREDKIAKIIPESVDRQASGIADDLFNVTNEKYNLSSSVVEKLTDACLKFIEK